MRAIPKRKWKLAMLFICLFVIGEIPYNGIGTSHAAMETISDIKYTVTWNYAENGMIEIGEGAVIDNTTEVTAGETVALYLRPNPECQVAQVWINGTKAPYESTNDKGSYYQLTLSEISQNMNIEVLFTKIPRSTMPVESLNLLLRDNQGELRNLEDSHIYYVNSYMQICSPNNYAYRLQYNREYEAQCIWDKETPTISYIYQREANPSEFGTEQLIFLEEPISLIIDAKAPQIKVQNTIWTNDKYSIRLCAEIEDDNLNYIVWHWDNETKEEVLNGKSAFLDLTDMFAEDNKKTVSLQAVDKAGNCSNETIVIGYDGTPPEITDIQIDASSKVSKLSDGNFSNHTVVLNITANDLESGVKAAEVYAGDDSEPYMGTCLPGDNHIKITIPYQEDGYFSELRTVSVRVQDSVGNFSHYYTLPQFQGSNNVKSDKLLIESMLPTAKISVVDDPSIYKKDDKVYFSDKVALKIEVEDKDSGLWQTTARVLGNNHHLYTKNYMAASMQKYEKDTYMVVVNAAEEAPIKNNVYEVVVNVTDSAGNPYRKTRKLYRDVEAPWITGYEMISEDTDVLIQDGFSVIETDYGYYFRDKTLVKIYASDGKGEGNCGVKEIQYYTIDCEGIRSVLSTAEAKEDAGRGSYIEVEIEEGFKGQLYACPIDHLKNCSDKFVGPQGTIIDTPEYHEQETHIQFQQPDAQAHDNKGQDLYNDDVSFTMTITDKMSGIQSVKWSVESPYDTGNNQQEYLEITNEGILTGGSDGWEILDTEKNLITEIKKTILVSNNSNDIEFNVEMQDRSGNVTQDKIMLSIDKTRPEIEIVFDNNTPDSEYADMFNADRTATIIVKECNFAADKISTEITNAEGVVPEISGWDTRINEANPHESTHTATVTFSNDGDYRMEISGEDDAHNQAETITVDAFTIDKTLPQIEVKFDNNDALNQKYYSKPRTAIISITEHNFTPKRVTVTGTVSNTNEKTAFHEKTAFPVIGSWQRNGDVYTAHILCDADGLYQFEVQYLDKAGNEGEKYVSDSYYIDKTAPTIEITGVEAFSANNGDVMPVVSMSDANYDVNGVEIQVIGINNGTTILQGEFVRQESGQIYAMENFPKELEYDDIYTLHVKVKDLAGNETTDEITFSVNRFGSVYIFDSELKQIVGTYVPEAADIRFTEINLDSLEHDTIKVIVDANGESRNLAEGIDYTVQQSHAEGAWYQYEYNIDHGVFVNDGRYIITLYSEDDAGNINQNIKETKKAEIKFGVDKTAPVVIPLDIESGSQYPVDMKEAVVSVNDNLVLKDVDIYIGSKKCEYTMDGENYMFHIPNADYPQVITIVAEDSAGNVTRYEMADILVTTNLFVRWYNNKPLLVGSLLCGLAVGGMGFFSFRKKMKGGKNIGSEYI